MSNGYWIVVNLNGKIAKESLFKTKTAAKWWADYFNGHDLYPSSDYKAIKVTLKRSK